MVNGFAQANQKQPRLSTDREINDCGGGASFEGGAKPAMEVKAEEATIIVQPTPKKRALLQQIAQLKVQLKEKDDELDVRAFPTDMKICF